jgi:hypothetical protein
MVLLLTAKVDKRQKRTVLETWDGFRMSDLCSHRLLFRPTGPYCNDSFSDTTIPKTSTGKTAKFLSSCGFAMVSGSE